MSDLPDGWISIKLKSLASKIGSGITPRGGRGTYLSDGVPLIRSQNVLVGILDLSDVAFISEEQHAAMEATQLKPYDVLLNITGASIGRSCIFPDYVGDANVNQHVCIIRANSGLNPQYLCALLNSDIGQKQIFSYQAGGNRQGLNFGQLGNFDIPLPPLAEQRKIAQILSTWDEAIALVEALIAALTARKKGLMQRLLTGEVRFPGFDDEWEEVRLGDVVDTFSGGTPSRSFPEYYGGNIPWIKSGEINQVNISSTEARL